MNPTASASASAHSYSTVKSGSPRREYPAHLTLAEARAVYFDENHFGDDGGYGAKWVDFKLGPFPLPFPNTAGRVRAVRYHDLHHIVTGYRTDVLGEFEISAWEVASGCADMHAAWVLNLGGLAGGILLAPRRTYRAFLRGRHSANLYRRKLDEGIIERRVGDVRAELGLDASPTPATHDDIVAAAGWGVVGMVAGLSLFAVMLSAAPIGLVSAALRSRRAP